MVGRGTRIEEGIDNLLEALTKGIRTSKVDCLVLDFVDITSRHNLTTLASLFGLGKADLKGKTVTEAVKADKEKKERKAAEDAKVTKKLDAVAKQVDLFKVQYAPEVLEFSKYQWIKVGPSAYVLLLRGSEHLVVMQDVQGGWRLSGQCMNNAIYAKMRGLRTAIEWADIQVRKYGGTTAVSLVNREAPWHEQPARKPMIRRAERAGIKVPKGIKKGDLSKKLNEQFALTTVVKRLKELGEIV